MPGWLLELHTPPLRDCARIPDIKCPADDYHCPEVAAFVERGQGSAEAVAAAMVAWRAAHPNYGYYDSEGYYDY